MTINYIYFYSYNKQNKNLIFVKKFNNIFGVKSHPYIIDLNIGKTLVYYINSNEYIQRINEKLLKFEDYDIFSNEKKYIEYL